METISRIAFGIASAALAALSLVLMVRGVVDLWLSFAMDSEQGGTATLKAGGYFIVAVAVFDVAKYLLLEEVVREREMRAPAEARRSLTKFVSTILLAVFLEALVTVFVTARNAVADMIYPTLLLLAGAVLIVCLGVYQRLSVIVEREAVEPAAPEQPTK